MIISSSAITLRCNASVDRTRIDKSFTMAKTASKNEELIFVGTAEPQERGAKGLLGAVG